MTSKTRNINKTFFVLALAAFCMAWILGTPGMAHAQSVLPEEGEVKDGDDYKYGDWRYCIKEDGTVYILGYEGALGLDVLEIPAEIKGMAVTEFVSYLDDTWPASYWRFNTLIIPETVTSFDEDRLSIGGLKEVIVKEGNPVYRSEDGIVYDKQMKTLLYCPEFKEGALTVPEGVEKIGVGAFSSSCLSEIRLPDSLREIGDNAFARSDRLTELVIPGNVDRIGRFAFNSCRKIKEIRFPDGIKTIGEEMFEYCLNLSDVYIPDSVESIEGYAFRYCDNLKTIRLPKALKSIGKNAFEYCARLDRVMVPEGTITIEERAFSSCDSLRTIRIPDSVKKIQKTETVEDGGFSGYGAFCDSGKVIIECSGKSYAKRYAEEVGIPYRIVEKAQGGSLGLIVNGQGVKGGQPLRVKAKTAYALQAVQEGAEAQVQWETSNEKVAAVEDGRLTVKKAGSASITATAQDGRKATIKLEAAKAAVRVSRVQVSGSRSMKPGSRQALELAVAPATADNAKVSWKSSDAKIAAVDRMGKVTAKKKGTVAIMAAARDKSGKTGKIVITVK